MTGANKGIGFEVVRLLSLAHPSWTVLLGSRSRSNAEAALEKLPPSCRANVRPLIIDVSDDASIAAAADEVKRAYGRLDYLFNNAAIVIMAPSYENTVSLIRTNMTGVQRVCEAFLPMMPDNTSRIVIVSSGAGCWAHHEAPAALRAKIEASDSLQWSELEALIRAYELSTAGPSYPGAELFPDQSKSYGAYGSSKMFLSAYARMLNHQLQSRGIPVMLVSPGYCSTDLSGHTGPRSAETGAKSLIMALDRPASEAGKLFVDHEEQPMAAPMPQLFAKVATDIEAANK